MGSSRRKKSPRANHISQQPQSTLQAPTATQKPPTVFTRLNEKSHHFSNWGQFGAFILAGVSLIVSLWTRSESDQNVKLLERQIVALETAFEKAHRLEVTPRLMADAPKERIKLFIQDSKEPLENPLSPVKGKDGIERYPFNPDTIDFLKVRNIGRTPASGVVAVTLLDRLIVGDKEKSIAHKDKPPAVVLKTIPAGESVPFESFHYHLEPSKEPQCLIGNFGLRCVDDDGYEHSWVQEFHYAVVLDDDEPYALMDIESPRLYWRSEKPIEKRHLDELNQHFRLLLNAEAKEHPEMKTIPLRNRP